MPYPNVEPVSITTFVDVDHTHDIETMWSVTGVLMFLNKKPIHCYNRWHNTVEISTYGSKMATIIIAT